MKKLILTLALAVSTIVGMNAQTTGDWYVGTADMEIDFHARYFVKGYFAYLATDGLSTEGMSIGAGKLFTLRSNIYIDPKIVYNTETKTTNLTLGFGFKF